MDAPLLECPSRHYVPVLTGSGEDSCFEASTTGLVSAGFELASDGGEGSTGIVTVSVGCDSVTDSCFQDLTNNSG